MSFRDVERNVSANNSSLPGRRQQQRQRQDSINNTVPQKVCQLATSSTHDMSITNGGEGSSLLADVDTREERNHHYFLRVEQHEDDYAMQVMREREEQIRDINRKMNVVSEIFKDLGVVVEQQQGQIDELEMQLGIASENSKKGLKELERANVKSQHKRQNNTLNVEHLEKETQKYCQPFSWHALFNGVSGVAGKISSFGKMIAVCGGSGSASYSLGENDNRR